MKKLKVMTVVGTRPEIIRLACVLKKLDASPAIDHVLVQLEALLPGGEQNG